MLVHGFLFVHFPRDFSLFAEFSGRILFKKKKRSQFRIVYGSVGKLDLGRCRMSPLCRRKNSSGRETSSIFYLKKREAVNRRDISIFFFFFFENFLQTIFYSLFLSFIFLSLRDAHPRSRFPRSSIEGLWFQISPRVAHLTSISSHLSRTLVIPVSTPLFFHSFVRCMALRRLPFPSFLVFPSSSCALFSPVSDIIVMYESRTRREHYRTLLCKFGSPTWNNNRKNNNR